MSTVVLDSPESVWSLLKDFASNKRNPDEVQLDFQEFPKIIIKFEGPNYNSSLPVRAMGALKAAAIPAATPQPISKVLSL